MSTLAGSRSSGAIVSLPIARIRFDEGAPMPALNSTVYVHMYYTFFTARIAEWLIWLFGLA